jgi:carbonic anhydrase
MDVRSLHRSLARARTGVLALVALAIVNVWPVGHAGGVSAAEATGPEFAYSGDSGPGFWGETPGWEACGGTRATARQSPVNIDSVVVDRHFGPLHLQLHETPLALTNNGHTIEEEYEPGSRIVLNGVAYDLTQFHFHTLSEHAVAGRHGVMELHAVFADPASSNKAVVGMLFVVGKSNRFLDHLLAHGLPKKSGEVVDVPSEEINLAEALTNTSRYYTYPGSLTTPPCSETVTWFVLHDYAQLSSAQLAAFRGILGNDFRPLQKRNGRVIRSTVRDEDHQH